MRLHENGQTCFSPCACKLPRRPQCTMYSWRIDSFRSNITPIVVTFLLHVCRSLMVPTTTSLLAAPLAHLGAALAKGRRLQATPSTNIFAILGCLNANLSGLFCME